MATWHEAETINFSCGHSTSICYPIPVPSRPGMYSSEEGSRKCPAVSVTLCVMAGTNLMGVRVGFAVLVIKYKVTMSSLSHCCNILEQWSSEMGRVTSGSDPCLLPLSQ